MAIAARCACQVRRQHLSYTPTQRRFWTPAVTNETQNIQFVGPIQQVGSDATPFTLNIVNGQASLIVPFYNLPAWTRGHPLTVPNYLQPFHNQLRSKQTYVQPMNQLFYETHVMGLQAPAHVRVEAMPRVIDDQNVVANGPFIGGGRSYQKWQATLTATADKSFTGQVTGFAVATVHHVFG
jgi:hypothetical protein